MKIRGSVISIEEQLKKARLLKRKDRFKPLLEHFKSLRNYLKYLGVNEEDDS